MWTDNPVSWAMGGYLPLSLVVSFSIPLPGSSSNCSHERKLSPRRRAFTKVSSLFTKRLSKQHLTHPTERLHRLFALPAPSDKRRSLFLKRLTLGMSNHILSRTPTLALHHPVHPITVLSQMRKSAAANKKKGACISAAQKPDEMGGPSVPLEGDL